jgi:hypothetical protein
MNDLAKALQASNKGKSSQNQQSQRQLDGGYETEQSLSHGQNSPQGESINPLANALSKAGGGKNLDQLSQAAQDQAGQTSPEELEKQKAEAEKKAKKEALRQKRHKEVNPLDMHEVYSRREEQTLRKLEQIRQQIKMEMMSLGGEVDKLYKDASIAATQGVVNQGQEGVGLLIFFEKLRDWIRFLRKKVKSARTWLQQSQAKAKKKGARKARKGGAGIEVGGSKSEQTKAVFDQMHHEASTAYSGF